jgi:two-component system chemotaxis response regulator CheY
MELEEVRLQSLDVFIVDDNQQMREFVRAVIQALGVSNIQEARDEEHAITKITDFQVDLVISDWVMEPMDGLELTKWIRTDPESPDLFMPVILLSGHTELEKILYARDYGITEIVAKPTTAKGLYAKILSIVDNPRPFVRTGQFFGPDRRRRVERFNGEDRRADEAAPPSD